jgi:uncharacterized protein (TIGR03083 family)
MSTSAIPLTDTRSYFRPVAHELVTLLRRLPPDAWERPTIARAWRVRDVVAHLLDTSLRRLSYHRDRHVPPSPTRSLASHEDFVAFINDLNADWIKASERMSPAVLTTLYSIAGSELADFIEQLPLDTPPLFPVSWAGDDGDAGWLDIGREFTEQWHHQMQVRDAVGAGPLRDPAWLRSFLLIALRGLPHAYRDVDAARDTAILIEITGDAGGFFTLRRNDDRWTVLQGADGHHHAHAALSDDTAWRLLFNALSADEAQRRVQQSGEADLLEPLLRARSVIV